MTADPRGYYRKFNVYRRNEDGTDGELVEERTFTLIPAHDGCAIPALDTYAEVVEETNPGLAQDLRQWIEDEMGST